MSNTQHHLKSTATGRSHFVSLGSIVTRYLYYWPYFIVSLVLSLAGAFAYLLFDRPLYQIKATLLVDDMKRVPDQRSPLHEIELSNASKVIENEIEILKSMQLVNKVVEDLGLNVEYWVQNGILKKELYQDSPVKLFTSDLNSSEQPQILTIKIIDRNSYEIISDSGESKRITFGETVRNHIGTFQVSSTENISKFTGSDIRIIVTGKYGTAIKYQKKIEVMAANKIATVLLLSIGDPNPQRGKDILNQLILNYNLLGKTQQTKEINNTLNFLDGRISSLKEELVDAEKGIAGFKSSRGLTDISSDSRISLENMQANDSRLNEVYVQLSVVNGIENYINSPQNSEKIPVTLGMSDPATTSLIEKLSQLQLQREKLLGTTPETNPDFQSIDRQIISGRAALKENIKNIKASLLSTQDKLKSFNSKFESSIKDIPTQERQYVSIKRQQTIKENLYIYLLQKREEVSVNYASTLVSDRIIDTAYTESVRSKKSLVYAIAVLLGLFIPTALIYMRNSVNSRILDLQDIESVLDIAVVGEISYDKANVGGIALTSPNAEMTREQFRSLRLKLQNSGRDAANPGSVILLTSSVAGEGKSFISTNLAASFARIEKRTIILELDLRKPKISEILGLSANHPGITNFLEGTCTEEEIIQHFDGIPNLDVIACGPRGQNPSELLGRSELKVLISDLRQFYDCIIIDSSPVHLVSDGLILSKIADQTLYVVRQGVTKLEELAFVNSLISQKQVRNVSLVFNGINKRKFGYGYDYDMSYYDKGQRRKTTVFN